MRQSEVLKREREAQTASLLRAAQRGDRPAVEELKASGGDVDAALVASVRLYEIETVRLLLDAGANPNARDRYASAMNHAVAWNDPAFLDLLLDSGADIDMPGDVMGESPLMAAAYAGRTVSVAHLLARGANIHYVIPDYEIPNPGGSALDLASGHPDVIRLLLAAGAKSARGKRFDP
jgi:ankyrin repeat protein